MKFRLLFLHGFLGSSNDFERLWAALQKKNAKRAQAHAIEYIRPSLFHPECGISLQSFDQICEDLHQEMSVASKDCISLLVGYSMGGRIALELLKRNPGFYDELLLIAAHPGLESEEQKKEKQEFHRTWKKLFSTPVSKGGQTWEELIHQWNQLPLFEEDEASNPSEPELSREKLAFAMERLGVDRQDFDLGFLRQSSSKIHGFVGEKDEKYKALYESLRSQNALASLKVIKGAGHRVLQKGAEEIADFLLRLLNQKGEVR